MLIICSECGKQFSDKAPACPNCGCPTEEVKGGLKQTLDNFKCEECGCEKYLIGETEYEKEMICYDCGKGYLLEKKKERVVLPGQVQCPFCHTTDVKKKTNIPSLLDSMWFGVEATRLQKQWHCNVCGSDF